MQTQQNATAEAPAEIPQSVEGHVGPVMTIASLRSLSGPYNVMSGYRVEYPDVVKKALGELFREYNRNFKALVEANREDPEDYRYCVDQEGLPLNRWVQIDMAGLTPQLMTDLSHRSVSEVREWLRLSSVYEIENSLAMYELLCELFEWVPFKRLFRTSLDEVRKKFGKPIALLAVTPEKYYAMLESEFGRRAPETVTTEEVKALTGFDMFFGPDEFRAYVKEHGEDKVPLLYVRSSDPVAKLKKPDLVVYHPLLEDPEMRRVIKAHTLTINIDTPGTGWNKSINDTKGYMPGMGLGHRVDKWTDVVTDDLAKHLEKGKSVQEFAGYPLAPGLARFLATRGSSSWDVVTGRVSLHAKPMFGTYGCYGHQDGSIQDRGFRSRLKKEMDLRGPYIIQPLMKPPLFMNTERRDAYLFIDRNFLYIDEAGEIVFLGGFRDFMPILTEEARKGRVHGNKDAVWAPIL